MTIHNAKISSTTLGVEDHGIPTSYVTCEFGSTQGFGGFNLGHADSMCRWVMGIQRVLGVTDWSKVVGQYCRIERDGGMIVAIGHIVEERWFTRDELYDSVTA